jgi:hypothetical protein
MLLHQAFHLERYVSDRRQSFLEESERDRLHQSAAQPRPLQLPDARRRPRLLAALLTSLHHWDHH